MWCLLIFPRMFFVAQGAYFFFFFTPRIFMSKTEAKRFLSWGTEFVSRHRSCYGYNLFAHVTFTGSL